MKAHFILVILAAGALCLSGCNDNNAPEPFQEGSMARFALPDSISRTLVIAMYDQSGPWARVVLAYTDDSRSSARKITYFSKDRVTVEPLVQLRSNEFRAPESKTDFLISGKTITAVYLNPSNNTTLSYNWSCGEHGQNPLAKEYRLMDI